MLRAYAFLLTALLSTSCITPVRLAVDEQPWLQLETENYKIWTSVGEPRARRLAQRMELFRSVTEFVIGQKLPAARLPARMFAFPDMATYKTFASRGSVGQYLPSMSENVMVASLSMSKSGHTTTAVIQHEYIQHRRIRHHSS